MKYYAKKTYREVEVRSHAVLILVGGGREWSASRLGLLINGELLHLCTELESRWARSFGLEGMVFSGMVLRPSTYHLATKMSEQSRPLCYYTYSWNF